MHPCHLRKHILTHDGLVGRNHHPRVRLHHPAHIVQPALVDVRNRIEMVLQDGLHTRQRRIAGPFTQSVDGGVQSLHTAQHGCQHIAHRQVIIVVGMKIKMRIRIALLHLAHKLNDLQRIEDAQRIGQHETADTGRHQPVHQLKHIVGRILYTVAPVFEIDIHADAQLLCIPKHLPNIRQVLLGRLLQLLRAMLQRALTQEIEHPAARPVNPVDRRAAVYKPQYLHLREQIAPLCPVADHLHRFKLPFRHPRGSHLHTVHLQVLQQQTGNHHLLVRHERYPARLLAVTQGSVHDFYLDAFFSHASIRSLLLNRKSISSSPFNRQCFL